MDRPDNPGMCLDAAGIKGGARSMSMSGSMVTATVSETGSVTEIAEAMTAPAGSMAGMQTTEAPTESENGSMTRGGRVTDGLAASVGMFFW